MAKIRQKMLKIYDRNHARIVFFILACMLLTPLILAETNFFGSFPHEWYIPDRQDTYYQSNSSTRQAGQTFRVGAVGNNTNFTFTGLSLMLAKSGNPDMTNISIQTLNSTGVPNGSIVMNTTFNATLMILNSSFTWVNISFQKFNLTANKMYAIVIDRTSINPFEVQWASNSTGNYAGGNTQYRYLNTWINVSTADNSFILWGYNSTEGFSINLLNPTNNQKILRGNYSFNSLLSVNDGNLINASFFLNNVFIDNVSLNDNSANAIFNYDLSTLGYAVNNWSIYGCTNYLCKMSEIRNFSAEYWLENNQIFNSSTFESAQENFLINISYIPQIYTSILGYLIYNNTQYQANQQIIGSNLIFSRNIIIPSVSSAKNVSFVWSFILTNSSGTTNINSSINNQTISTIGSGVTITPLTCSAGTSAAFYFNFQDETNLTALTPANIYYNLQYGLSNSSTYTINNNLSNVANFTICINNSFPYFNVGYGEVQYQPTGYAHRRYYIFQNTRITNQTINTTLYSLDDSQATAFQLTIQSTALVPFANSYVSLMRWYPNLNSYKVVEIGKTDNNGQAVLKVKTEDVDYRIGIYTVDGILVDLLDPIRMVCATTPCTYSIYITSTETASSFFKVQSNLSFDTTSKIFTFIWNDPTQLTQTMNLSVYKLSGNSYTAICSNTATGFTGVLTCDASSYTGTLKAIAYRQASPPVVIAQLIKDIRETLAKTITGGSIMSLFISVILLIFAVFLGIFSPIGVIMFTMVALIPAVLLGSITPAIFIAIGALGGIVWHFLKNTTG